VLKLEVFIDPELESKELLEASDAAPEPTSQNSVKRAVCIGVFVLTLAALACLTITNRTAEHADNEKLDNEVEFAADVATEFPNIALIMKGYNLYYADPAPPPPEYEQVQTNCNCDSRTNRLSTKLRSATQTWTLESCWQLCKSDTKCNSFAVWTGGHCATFAKACPTDGACPYPTSADYPNIAYNKQEPHLEKSSMIPVSEKACSP